MGWNTLAPTAGARLFEGTGEAPFVYFVHSYFPEPADPSIITASCEYGIRFAAACGCGEVQAVQFHPEKSQGTGLQILRNFLSIASAVS
jgi:glutamine amidotransferase